jgi:CRP/FNR family cyclic AMP-dependent transcriptional regulator
LDADTPPPRIRATPGTNWLALELPEPMYTELVEGSRTLRVRAGEPLFDGRDAPRTGLLTDGVARAYLTATDGRQFTIRYVRPGSIIGAAWSLAPERATVRVEALTDCELLELDVDTLRHLTRTRVEVACVLLGELNRRLYDLHTTLAASAFGTMRERIARHLLDLSAREARTGSLVVAITQQQLADSVGTVREVAARVLSDLRRKGMISTTKGRIEVVDARRLASVAGRWQIAHGGPQQP